MKITVIEIVEKNGEVDFVSHDEEREFPNSQGRHKDLCVFCGFSTYPACREWCPNEKTSADKS